MTRAAHSSLACACAMLLAAVAAPPPAAADTLGLHIGSRHSTPGYNNSNPGLVYRTTAGWTAGGYCNSESRSERFPDAPRCQVSLYAGRTWQWELAPGIATAVTAGGITGYSRAQVMPLAVPSVLFGGHVRLLYAPKLAPKGSHVLSLVLETAL
jgi:hypothetical protein